MTKKSPFVKVFIRIALLAILLGVISPFAIYFVRDDGTQNNCEEGYIRDENTQECIEDNGKINDENEPDITTKEGCEAAGMTWYDDNNICIK